MITEEMIEKYADAWLTAKEIEDNLDIARSTVFSWSSRGIIRSRPIENITNPTHPRRVYHAGDCIQRRSKRRKQRPFKRRVVNGITIYCCNYCNEWKQKDSFYEDKHSTHGILTHCKKCYRMLRNKKGRTPEQKYRYNENEKAQMRVWREMARAATEWNNNPTVDAAAVIEIIEEVRPGINDTEICVEARVHQETVRAIRRAASKNRPVKLSTVDGLLTGLGEAVAQRRLYDEIDKHRPRWHNDYDYCQTCFRTKVAHAAKGYCQTCYRNRNNADYKPLVERGWSMRHACCTNCKTTRSKYAARGLCNACYQKAVKRGTVHQYTLDYR